MASADEIRAGRAAVEITGDNRKLKESVNESHGVLETLKRSFGRGSAFQETGELLKGAGVVAGLTIAGEVLKNATGKAVELKNALVEGKMSGGEMANEFAKSLPILGGIVEAGANIHELFTSEKFILKQWEELNTELGVSIKRMYDLKAATEAFKKSSEESVAGAERGIVRTGIKDPTQGSIFDIQTGLQDQLKGISKKGESFLDSDKFQKAKEESDKLNEKLKDLNKQKSALEAKGVSANGSADGGFWTGVLWGGAAQQKQGSDSALLRETQSEIAKTQAAINALNKAMETAKKGAAEATKAEAEAATRLANAKAGQVVLDTRDKMFKNGIIPIFGGAPDTPNGPLGKESGTLATIGDFVAKGLKWSGSTLEHALNVKESPVFSGFASQLGNAAFGTGDLNSTTKDILKNTDIIARNISSGGMAFS